MHRRCLSKAREREADDGKAKKDLSDCLVSTHFCTMRNVEKDVVVRWMNSQVKRMYGCQNKKRNV